MLVLQPALRGCEQWHVVRLNLFTEARARKTNAMNAAKHPLCCCVGGTRNGHRYVYSWCANDQELGAMLRHVAAQHADPDHPMTTILAAEIALAMIEADRKIRQEARCEN